MLSSAQLHHGAVRSKCTCELHTAPCTGHQLAATGSSTTPTSVHAAGTPCAVGVLQQGFCVDIAAHFACCSLSVWVSPAGTCRPLQEGDIINIDVTVYLNGYHGDTSRTFYVGKPSANAQRLVEATEEALQAAIKVNYYYC